MPTETETASLKQTQPAAPPRPYTKPAVERIPLSEARAALTNNIVLGDLVDISS
jgi:hypothetical protein